MIDYILGLKTGFSKFKSSNIIPCVFFDQDEMNIRYYKQHAKYKQLESKMLLNVSYLKFSKEMKKSLEINEDDNTAYLNL